jgi:hypothetical protein
MKKILFIAVLLTLSAVRFSFSSAQIKPRPDAFPPVEESAPKALTMATTVDQMANWNRYPTYSVYVDMMQGWAVEFPSLCKLDTIGTSVSGRLILSLEITAHPDNQNLPEFFYSSTMHGDEITGYVMMLRLIDTLLHGYGNNPQYTSLIESTRICINPLANPDGTYYGGNNSVQASRRYNANGVDLNRNYPNPFGGAKEALQPENAAMIAYFDRHNFRLSANLHGGSEVMNYPWDCYTSLQNPHPQAEWWKAVCKRFVDTSRTYSSNHFNDVNESGYIAGGDWYVITGGRQDYFNYYYNCLELTMEVSTTKKLSSTQLPTYWNFLQHSLVNYIAEIHSLYSNEYTVTALSSDTTMGYVDGTGTYTENSTAVVTAYALDGYSFDHWMDGDVSNPRSVTVTSDTTLTAYFTPDSGGFVGIRQPDNEVRIRVQNGCIVVDESLQPFHVYDIMGRETSPCVPQSGIYFIKAGNLPTRKLVVLDNNK